MSNLDRRNLLKGMVLGAITPLESLKGLMEPDIPVIKFGLTRAPITAKTRKLVGKWTLEPAQVAMFGPDYRNLYFDDIASRSP